MNTAISPRIQNNSPKFKGIYTSKNFYQLDKDLSANKTILPLEIKTIHESIEAFEALNRCINKGKVSANQISDQMKEKYGVNTEFHGDTFLACCAAFASNAMHKLGFVQPKHVEKGALEENVLGCCGVVNRKITYTSNFNWAKDAQDQSIEERINNFGASGHFLSTPVHEYMHSVHMNHMTEIEKRNSVFPFYPNHSIRRTGINDIAAGNVKDAIDLKISKYGGTMPVEAFAEYYAKLICENLDPKTLLPKKQFYFDMIHQPLKGVIKDFWDGNFNKYI